MTAAIDISGQRFGFLVALNESCSINGRRMYTCICDCGIIKDLRVESLRSGVTKSCGCLRNKKIGNLNKSHQMCSSPEYKSWSHAKQRIFNKKNKKYKNYGGRGIQMCKEWSDSFESFFKDMGKKPSPSHSLGRIDVDGNYCKENCRWETSSQQARERTDNIFVFIDGSRVVLKDACKILKIPYKATHSLMKYKNFTFESVRKKYGV